MNNEPAFPLQSIGPDFAPGWSGMTLRDYFAAKAMQGFAADHEATFTEGVPGMAAYAYKWADAMLAARGAKYEIA